jgi:2,4-dienoyl-CoA reductase-like NADH-dependent reductase (Old Yellow Enzyme family)
VAAIPEQRGPQAIRLPSVSDSAIDAIMLFTPQRIGALTIPNRIVKSAMAEGRCNEDGVPSPALVRLYEQWAEGGVGLAISGMAYVRRGYSYTGREIGLYDEPLIEPLRALTAAVHRHEGRIFAQLCWAPPQLPRKKAQRLGSASMSPGFNKTNLLFDRAHSDAELRTIVAEFAAAGRRAREAGFDGVQLHGAHGYLISRSLSPKHNRRHDCWGGSFDGRMMLVREIYRTMRASVGADFPITIKLNAHDGESNGLDLSTGVRVARAVAALGFDAIEVSAGIGDVGLGCYPNKGGIPIDSGSQFLFEQFPALKLVRPFVGPALRLARKMVEFPGEAYFEPLARRIAEAVDVPVICVGGIRSRDVAERILRETKIAMVSLARPLVREPDLPNRWREGSCNTAACTSCNECFVHLGFQKPLACHSRRGEFARP